MFDLKRKFAKGKKVNKKEKRKQKKTKKKLKKTKQKQKEIKQIKKETIGWIVIGLIGTNVGEYVAGAFFCLDAIEKLIEKTRSEEVSEITVKVFFLEMIKVIKNRVKT